MNLIDKLQKLGYSPKIEKDKIELTAQSSTVNSNFSRTVEVNSNELLKILSLLKKCEKSGLSYTRNDIEYGEGLTNKDIKYLTSTVLPFDHDYFYTFDKLIVRITRNNNHYSFIV